MDSLRNAWEHLSQDSFSLIRIQLYKQRVVHTTIPTCPHFFPRVFSLYRAPYCWQLTSYWYLTNVAKLHHLLGDITDKGVFGTDLCWDQLGVCVSLLFSFQLLKKSHHEAEELPYLSSSIELNKQKWLCHNTLKKKKKRKVLLYCQTTCKAEQAISLYFLLLFRIAEKQPWPPSCHYYPCYLHTTVPLFVGYSSITCIWASSPLKVQKNGLV